MADTLTRRSPLQGYETRFANLPQSATSSRSRSSRWSISGSTRPDPVAPRPRESSASTRCRPRRPPRCPAAMTTVIWLGPEEWLVTSDEPRRRRPRVDAARCGVRARRRRDRRFRPAHDPSAAGRTRSRRHRQGLFAGLHPAVFGPGAAAQTDLGQAGVVLIPLSDNGTDYRIIVRSSFAALSRRLADRRRRGVRRRLVM